jgi:hypothetical protein
MKFTGLNTKWFIRWFTCLLLVSFTCYPQNKHAGKFNTYKVGERLTYNVSFAHFNTAAHIELLVVERGIFFNREGIKLRAHIETLGEVRATLLSLNNEYISYIDPTTGLPFQTEQLIHKGLESLGSTFVYNQPAASSGKNNFSDIPGTHDLISALYKLRNLPLARGNIYRMNIQMDKVQYKVELKVGDTEKITVNSGNYISFPVQVKILNNDRANNYNIRINLEANQPHIPLLITANHINGKLQTELASVSEHTGIMPMPKHTNSTNEATSSPTPLPFSTGEQLNYKIYSGMPSKQTGTLTLQVKKQATYFGQEGLLFTSNVHIAGQSIDILGFNAQINSYVNPLTILPFRTESVPDLSLTIDQQKGKAITDKNQVIHLPNNTHDPLSIIYALRYVDLKPPKRKLVSILIRDKVHKIFITSVDKDFLELGGQKIPAIKLNISTEETPEAIAVLWIGTDYRKLPLRILINNPQNPFRADLAIMPALEQ